MARSWPFPRGDRTLHLVGDLHAGAIAAARTTQALADMQKPRMPIPALHLQVGDLTDAATSGQDTTGLAFLNALPGPKRVLVGNHDTWEVRTGDAAATAWGLPGTRNFTYDLGFALLIAVSANGVPGGGDKTTQVLDATALEFLDDELAAASKDCIVACHAPLQNTVGGDSAANWNSIDYASMSVDPDADIRAILSARPRAKFWVSGHTHSHVDLAGFVKVEDVGDRNVIALNSSALYYTGKTAEPLSDPIRSIYLTFVDSGNYEVRVRDHGGGVWSTIDGDRVTPVAVPA